MGDNPILKIELTTTDKFMEFIGWLALVCLWLFVLINYSSLPDVIPVHFDGAGKVNGSGSRATILVFPIVASILLVSFTWLNKHPHIFNYPKAITPSNIVQQYTNATRMVRYFKFAIAFAFLLIAYLILEMIKAKSDSIGIWVLPMVLGLIFIPLIYFLIKFFKTK